MILISSILFFLLSFVYIIYMFSIKRENKKYFDNRKSMPKTIIVTQEPKPVEKFNVKEISSFTIYNKDTGEIVLHIENK